MTTTRWLARSTCAVALACSAAMALAQPIAAPGTEGLKVVVGTDGEVVATYLGSTASYNNDLFLGATALFNNQSTPVGTTVNLGSFTAGTELVFRLQVNNSGDSFFSGPGTRNADGKPHARAQADYLVAGTTLVSFEDLYDGPFDFNDTSFSFSNTAAVPEPATLALLLAGGAALALRRRRTS
jgi:hypothetical protein